MGGLAGILHKLDSLLMMSLLVVRPLSFTFQGRDNSFDRDVGVDRSSWSRRQSKFFQSRLEGDDVGGAELIEQLNETFDAFVSSRGVQICEMVTKG